MRGDDRHDERADLDDRRSGSREPGPDRYEPLPGIASLPGWVWRRLGRLGRIVLAAVLVAIAAAAVLAAPGIRTANEQRASEDRRAEERERVARTRELRKLVRPQRVSVPADDAALPAPARRVARAGMVADLRRAIARDSRRRDGDSIEEVSCQPAAGEPGRAPARELAAASARLSCLAVTTSFAPGEASEGGRIGNPYRAVVDFARGRITYCRSYGRPGEASLERRILVTLPRACGG